MEGTAKIQWLSRGMGGELLIALSVSPTHIDAITKLKDEDLTVRIDKHRNRRSLTANGYCWKLITLIAEKIFPPQSKEEIYQQMLKRYGQGGFVTIQKNELYESILRTFDYYEEKGTGETKGKEFGHLMVWVGSSKYNSREMWVFISGIQDEARELGIEVLPPDELRRMTEGLEK